MYDFFISYKRLDLSYARQIKEMLEHEGFSIYLDVERLLPSVEFRSELAEKIRQSRNFLFLISPDSLESMPCREELRCAISYNKWIIAVECRPSTPPYDPYAQKENLESPELLKISNLNWIRWPEIGLDNTIDQIIKSVGKGSMLRYQKQDEANPLPGADLSIPKPEKFFTKKRVFASVLFLLFLLGGLKFAMDQRTSKTRATVNQYAPVDVVDLPYATQISSGENHTCALTKFNGVWCWGWNLFGQIGKSDLGTSVNHPIAMNNVLGTITEISAGGLHACALASAGDLHCWGDASADSAGWPTSAQISSPGIFAGGQTTCGLTPEHGLKCWGANGFGQLGDGTTITRTAPAEVTGLASGVISASAGGLHTCALMNYGGVKCWGWNAWGQIGDGAKNNNYTTPRDVFGLNRGVISISAGWEHTCVLMNYGGVKCWGDNYYGELGDGSANDQLMPVDVVGLGAEVTAISSGKHHTCAVMNYGGVKCWGANDGGQLGNGERASKVNLPVDVIGLSSGAIGVSAGSEHTCALMKNGGVKCWGNDYYGQLGDGRDVKALPQ